jgi:hypothetical protein
MTLEGVPAYFVERRPLLIDILPEATRARHFRISMGLQTFDLDQLRNARGPDPVPSPLHSDRNSTALFYAVKTVNPDSATDYGAAVETGARPWESVFLFSGYDLRLLYLTRKIATLGVDRAADRGCFGSDCVEDFPLEFGALAADQLTEQTPETVRLTPRGMFYADTIAGLLAWRHVESFRSRQRAAEAARIRGQHGRAHVLEFGQLSHLFSYMG